MTAWTDASPRELADALKTALLLSYEPVGVRLFRDRAGFDASPLPRPDSPLSYCAAVRTAALGGALKLDRDDIACDTSPRTLGLEPGFRDEEFVRTYVTCGLYRDREAATSVLAGVAILSDTAGVAVAPLARFETCSPPDVVIVPISPYGAMRIVQALAYRGDTVHSASIGMHGICAECTARPHATGDVSVSLLCSGTRHVAGWEEGLMAAGMPMARVPGVVAGLVDTAERYEPDGRKAEMKAACRSGAPTLVRAPVDRLTAGEGYFCEQKR
ncbi:MAG TPA: DUF169 domain-containing protein [Coriobacteriia bacterium]|nr:DUF169 domain-containing protein [Coriobacteriia bacterium]